jgi:hypothetical protein
MRLKDKAAYLFFHFYNFCTHHSAAICAFTAIICTFIALHGCYDSKKTSHLIEQNQKVMEKLVQVIEPLSVDQLNRVEVEKFPVPLKKPDPPNDFTKKTKDAAKVLAACILLAADTYSIPPAVLVGIYKMEGGVSGGKYGPLKNRSYDLGVTKINTSLIPMLAKKWGVDDDLARAWVRYDSCTNLGVTAWILRTKLDETKNLNEAIELYAKQKNKNGKKYKQDLINLLRDVGLIREK